MEHGMHLVDILNNNGAIVGSKRRRDIDKANDIYHGVHTILITPRGEVVLSTIPVREDLPNIFATKKGATVATIRRTNETSVGAAERSVARELFIDHMPLVFLGEEMYHLPSQKNAYISFFYGISEAPESYSLIDIAGLEVFTPHQIDKHIEDNTGVLAETLVAAWERYKDRLPI